MLRPSKSTELDSLDDVMTSSLSSSTILTTSSGSITTNNNRKKKNQKLLRIRKSQRTRRSKYLFFSDQTKEIRMQRLLFVMLFFVLVLSFIHSNSSHENANEVKVESSSSSSSSHQLLRNKISLISNEDEIYHNRPVQNNETIGENHDDDDSIILHIVNTRFMQHQPNLTTLATARLHLFKTFCLPSMIQQSIQNFYWIIKIDPKLDASIHNQLIELVESYPNIYIIGSNENYLVGTTPGSWRGREESSSILKNIQEHHVFTGNVNNLRTIAQKANMNNIILETRLDADDGLNHRYLEYVQIDALKRFQHKNNKHQITKWFFWCVEKHAKWYPTKDSKIGRISGERRLDFCITPGLTVGYNIDTRGDEVPYYPHHTIFNQLFRNRTLTQQYYDCKDDLCITFIKKMVAAVRSRTHTSAGMADVEYSSKVAMQADMTKWIWQKLKDEFGVTEENVAEMHRYLQDNVKEIAKENLEGQCSNGHSCKKGSKEKLKQLLVDS